MLENDDDILVQGKTYQPKGEGYVSPEVQEFEEEIGVEEAPTKSKFDVASIVTGNKVFVVGAAIALSVLFMLAIVVIGSGNSKRKKAEEAERAASLLEESTEEIFFYTTEELEELRIAGYTGTEIEEFEMNAEDVDVLVQKAKEERYAQYESEIIPYFNNASDEFKALCKDTWVGQDEIVLDKIENKNSWQYYTETVNVDYSKLSATGMQCFIKCNIFGNYVFVDIAPDRYLELEDYGNIVLSITYTVMTNGTKVLTNVTEIIP